MGAGSLGHLMQTEAHGAPIAAEQRQGVPRVGP